MRITQIHPDDDLDTEERIRKGRGRLSAYRSSKPKVRREVRLAGATEVRKATRAARSLKVTLVCDEPLAELRNLAYADYRAMAESEGRAVSARTAMHPRNLDRITVNYLRHTRTEYDRSLIRSRVGSSDLHAWYNREVKARCLALIAEAFPELAEECNRQSVKVVGTLKAAAAVLDQQAA